MKRIRLALLLALFCALWQQVALAEDVNIQGSMVSRNGDLVLKTRIPRFVNPELVNVLRSGVAITVNYELRVYRKTPLPNFVTERKINHKKSLAYSVQDDIYIMQSPGLVVKNPDLTVVLESFYAEDQILVGKSSEFKPEPAEYFLKFRLATETIKLYPPLSLIFNLIEIYNFKTSWKKMELEPK